MAILVLLAGVINLCVSETTPKASLPLDSESPAVSLSSAAKPSIPVEQHQVPSQSRPPPTQVIDSEVSQTQVAEPVTQQVRMVHHNIDRLSVEVYVSVYIIMVFELVCNIN